MIFVKTKKLKETRNETEKKIRKGIKTETELTHTQKKERTPRGSGPTAPGPTGPSPCQAGPPPWPLNPHPDRNPNRSTPHVPHSPPTSLPSLVWIGAEAPDPSATPPPPGASDHPLLSPRLLAPPSHRETLPEASAPPHHRRRLTPRRAVAGPRSLCQLAGLTPPRPLHAGCPKLRRPNPCSGGELTLSLSPPVPLSWFLRSPRTTRPQPRRQRPVRAHHRSCAPCKPHARALATLASFAHPPRCRCDLITDGPALARARPPAFGRGRPCRRRPAAIPASRGRARSGRAWPRPVGLAPRTPAPTPATPVPAKGPYGPQTCGAPAPERFKKKEF